MKNTFFSLLLLSISLFTLSCKDKEPDPEDLLGNTSWVVALNDENPGSNPSGGNYQYYAWSACNQDDVISFQGGRIVVDNGGTICDNDQIISMFANQNYTYNSDSKTLTVASGLSVDVLELNDSRLKLALSIPSGTVVSKLIFIFRKR